MPARACLFATVIALSAASACAPAPGPGQVATHVIPPPGRNPYLVRNDEALCKHLANGDVRIFVACIRRRGYRVEAIGPGGVAVNIKPPPIASRAIVVPPPYQQPAITGMAPLPLSPPSEENLKYADLLDHLVAQDAQSWALNQYDTGSMRNVTIAESDGKRETIKGYYTYDHGKPGWVEVEFVGSHLSCLHYWDRTDCRKLGEGAGKEIEATQRQAQEAARHPSPQQAGKESTNPGFVNGPSFCNAFVNGSMFSWRTPLNPCNE